MTFLANYFNATSPAESGSDLEQHRPVSPSYERASKQVEYTLRGRERKLAHSPLWPTAVHSLLKQPDAIALCEEIQPAPRADGVRQRERVEPALSRPVGDGVFRTTELRVEDLDLGGAHGIHAGF